MRKFFKSKLRWVGLAIAFGILFGLVYLTGTVSGSRNAAFAQATTPGQPTPTQATVTPGSASPTPSQMPATPQTTTNQESGEQVDGDGGTPGKEGTEAQNDTSNQAALQAQAKVSVEQAKQTALAKVPGTVVSTLLEDENGKVVYAVVVTPSAGGANQEIKVNADDATVLKVEAGGDDHSGGNEEGQD